MENFFLTVLDMSLKGSYVIAALLLVRLLLKKAPKKYSYILWVAAAFRLVCPVSFSSAISLFRLAEPEVPQNLGMMAQPQIETGIPAVNQAISQSLPAATPMVSANPMQIWIAIGALIWCVGMGVLLLHALISYLRLRRSLSAAVRLEGNVWQGEIPSPFILGFFRPNIYVPYGLEGEELDYVLCHERYHLRRGDHLVKPLAYLILILHWFNPLVWLSFSLMGKDMEMRCDEAVLAKKQGSAKFYGQTLLSFAAGHRFPGPSPLAFGESGVKTRIKNILSWKKPGVWITAMAVIVCVAVLVACSSNPPAVQEPETMEVSKPEEVSSDPVPEQEDVVSSEWASIPEEWRPETLEQAIHEAIMVNGAGKIDPGAFACESHVILAHITGDMAPVDETDPKAIVSRDILYMVVLYNEFVARDGQLEDVGGGICPVALTITSHMDDTCLVEEYWMPKDGSYYLPSIREKFPEHLWETVDTQLYVQDLMVSCYDQAVAAGLVDGQAAVKQIIDSIEADTDYDRSISYRELSYYGDHTLRYCYGEFLKGGQTGKRGSILHTAMDNNLGGSIIPYEALNGQDYFDNWLEHGKNILERNGPEFIWKFAPKVYMALEMAGLVEPMSTLTDDPENVA